MRYLSVPSREVYESRCLPQVFGKTYQPHGAVTLRSDALLEASATEFMQLEGEPLAIVPDTASWAFLSKEEASHLEAISGASVAAGAERWPTDAPAPTDEFIESAFRRGLLTIDGRQAVDSSIFDDSPNVSEGHLVELLVTERCNLGCTYCLAGTHAHMPRMTPAVARRTVDLAFSMPEAHVLAFEFSGGEPFMEFGLMRELVSYIREHPRREERTVHLNVQTNATLLDRERVAWLRDNDIRVGVSLDGVQNAHDKSRPTLGGRSSFSQLISGLRLLRDMHVPFGALVVLNRSNIEGVAALAEFLLDNGIHSFKLNPVAFLGTARGKWSEVGLEQQEVVAYFQQLLELIVAERLPLLEDNLRTMCEFLVSKQRASRCLRSHCGAGDSFQAISASGDIYPCGRATQSPGLKLGNVNDSTLLTLSEPARRSDVIADIRERRPRTLEGCVTCPYRQLCQAGCSAQAFERYGTVRHRTPECHFYKTMYPYLMRKLSFAPQAVATLNRFGYFQGSGVVVNREHLAGAQPVTSR